MNMTLTKIRKLKSAIDNNEAINCNGSEIATLLRKKFNFDNAIIVQTRGNNDTAKKSRESLEKAGVKNFVLVLDLDAVRGL
jgi:hypothetical protein